MIMFGVLMVTAAEVAAVGAALMGWFWPALALHLLACLGLGAWVRFGRDTAANGGLRLLAILLPGLGPIALATGALALLISPFLRRQSSDAEAWRATLFPAPEEDGLDDRFKRSEENATVQRDSGRVVAFADVLRLGDLPQQERVVALMAREYRPAFAPLLRAALNAPVRSLRAQAAAALSLIEARFAAEVQTLRAGPAPAKLALKLDEMANSGLWEEGRTRSLRSEAASIWEVSAAADPTDERAAAALGRDLLQLGQVTAGREALERAYALGLASAALLGWLAEARFLDGDLEGVENLLAAHRADLLPLLLPGSPLAPALRLWLTENAA